jgi:hypothetical protein
MRRKTTSSVEASTTVGLVYPWEYSFGRTFGHAMRVRRSARRSRRTGVSARSCRAAAILSSAEIIGDRGARAREGITLRYGR